MRCALIGKTGGAQRFIFHLRVLLFPSVLQTNQTNQIERTNMKNTVRSLILTGVLAFAGAAPAQVMLSGTGYTQNFNDLGSGLPPGWSVRTNATATSLGSAAVFTTNSTSWGSTSGQFANYASTLSNYGTNFLGTNESTAIQAACTNRCLALRQTGSFGDPGAAFVFQIQNTLGFANFQLTVDFDILSVQGRSNVWTIDYGIGNNPASFTLLATNVDPGLFGATAKVIPFGNVLDNLAQNVWIRIVALDSSAGSGSRDTFGIDNFSLSYGSPGTVSPIPLRIQSVGGNAVLTWTNSSFVLQAAPTITGPYSNVPGTTSPYTNFMAGSQRYFRLIH
jgi:hypothetical protein